MNAARATAWLVLLLTFVGGAFSLWQSSAVVGKVEDERGPVSGALVRWQGTRICARTDRHGRFSLPALSGHRLTAWKEDYRIAAATLPALKLRRLPAVDNDDYQWVDPRPDRRQANNCANCHKEIYDEWAKSAHARSATNLNFLELYAGGDGTKPPRKTWNLLEEHPLGAGVCASCHAPTLRDPDLTYDVRQAKGVTALGVHCDYCHKVVDAPVDKLGTRFGREGLTLLRPAQDDQLFFGPLDDAVRPGESFGYSPLYRQSRYCASCHEAVLFGVHVYGTYSEWLASPAPAQGKTCQTCHMAPTGHLTNIAHNHGGIERDPRTLASHYLPGGTLDMLRRCLTLTTRVQAKSIIVTLEAKDVGHAVPTGFIDRHLLLVVEGFDNQGQAVALRIGPKLPAAAGPGWEGLPGVLYAKLLTGEDGRSPLPFWIPPAKMDDTRLRPGHPDTREFQFVGEVMRWRVRVLYRRLWPAVGPAVEGNEMTVLERTLQP